MSELAQVQEGSALVLIVDGDPVAREVTRTALENEGYSVVEAVDGYDGLRRYDEVRPDLVLLEFDLPEFDGAATCRQLRVRYPTRATPRPGTFSSRAR